VSVKEFHCLSLRILLKIGDANPPVNYKAGSASMARPLEIHPDDKLKELFFVLRKGMVITIDSSFVIIILLP
jgi:hypothetical protein